MNAAPGRPIEKTAPAAEKEALTSRVSLFFALLLLNSVIYQFATYMTFFEGMDALGIGLVIIYALFTLVAMYQRRLSLMSLVAQLALSAAFFNLGNAFILSARVPVGVVYIKQYISVLLFASQFLAPARFISRRAYLTALWCVAGMFVLYVLAALCAGIVEQETAIRVGGYAILGERGLGPDRWRIIVQQSCMAAGIVTGMIVLSLSSRGDWPADRKRKTKPLRPRHAA